ncbi:IS701 family transposase [Spirosoma arboris]|uniref:IS701 family transposase n=1 Tax=Spirosoma arboris TaxID=2682092 RepID=UPI0037443EF6
MKGLTLEQDLYSDYLVVNQGQATATGLAALLDQQISHDRLTRSLSVTDYGSAQLWQVVKPFVQQIAHPDGLLLLDDTVEEKPYSQPNELISYHFDHTQGRSVKGINQLTALYHSQETSLPVGFHLIRKTKTIQTKKGLKRVSEQTKQQLFRDLIRQAIANQLPFKYVLADSWYGSVENINYLIEKEKQFIFALKTNRQVALCEADNQQGQHRPMSDLGWEETTQHRVWLAGVETALLLTRLVFDNKDDSRGTLYLLTNDLTVDATQVQSTYGLRWRIEEFYKSIKSNTGYAASPTHRVRTQSNHLFLSMVAFVKLEALKVLSRLNHFALKAKLTQNALKHSWQQWQDYKQASTLLALYA